MRKLVLLLTSLITVTSFASRDYGLRICNSILNSSDKQMCIREVSVGNFYSHHAVSIVEQFFFLADKIDGIRAIRDRGYSPSEIQMCNSFFSIADKIQCLRTSGTQVRPNPPRNIRRQIMNAIEAIEDGRDRRAIRILERVLEQTR